MRYVLGVSIGTQVYKKPKLEFRLNSRLLDEYSVQEDHGIEFENFEKKDFFKLWGADTLWPKKVFPILLAKKWIIFEIDDKDLCDENTLDIIFKNFTTNNTNGFITKRDMCNIYDIILMPRFLFGVSKIKNIFEHCTSRNIMTYFSCGEDQRLNLGAVKGWPVYSAQAHNNPRASLFKNTENFDPSNDDVAVEIQANADRSHKIVWDERLGLHRIQNFDPTSGKPLDHTLLKDFYENFVSGNGQLTTPYDPEIHAPKKNSELQPGLIPNDETTLLGVHAQSIISIQRLENKYQYENQ